MMLAMDTQGLQRDRLLHVRVLREREAEGQANDASVIVTKGRFSEEKRRFIERSETFTLPAGSSDPCNIKVLALDQVLNHMSNRLCICFVVRAETGKNATLALCRLVEGDDADNVIQPEKGGGGSGRRSKRVIWEVLEGGDEAWSVDTFNFAVVPGPCILAWKPVYESSNKQGPRVHCWYRKKWHVYPLRTASDATDDIVNISFQGSSTQIDGGFIFRVKSHLSPSTFAWSVLELPPFSTASSSSSTTFSSSSDHINTANFPSSPYTWLPASALEGCACVCEPLAFNFNNDQDTNFSGVYMASSTELSFLSSSHKPPEEPVCLAQFPSLSRPARACALLARPQPHENAPAAAENEKETTNAEVIEHVVVLFGGDAQDPVGRLMLFARVCFYNLNKHKHHHRQVKEQQEQGDEKQELHPLREFQGLAGMLRGDFLGYGWDQLALLPSSSSTLDGMGEVALTDLVHVWGPAGHCKLEDAPVKLLEDKAAFRAADKARKKAAAAAFTSKGGGHENTQVRTTEKKKKMKKGEKRHLVEERFVAEEKIDWKDGEESVAAAAAPTEAEGETKERVLGKIQDALRQRLHDEEAEKRGLAQVEAQKRLLLIESERILTSMAYQDVLPSTSRLEDVSGDGGSGCGGDGGVGEGEGIVGSTTFAASLRPLLEASDGSDKEQAAFCGQRQAAPLFPIASHQIVRQEVDADSQRVALEVILFLSHKSRRLRLEELSLAVFSQHGSVTFTSSTIKDSDNAITTGHKTGNDEEVRQCVRLQVTFTLSAAALLDPLTWVGEVTLCCAWRRLTWKEGENEEVEEEEIVYPPGAQPLEQLTFCAREFDGASISSGISSSRCTIGGEDLSFSSSSSSSSSSISPLLWRLEATVLSSCANLSIPLSWSSRIASARLDPMESTYHLAAIDLPTLCTTLHNILKQTHKQTSSPSSSSFSSSTCSLVPSDLIQPASSFLRGLAWAVALLQEELELLCTLVEGGEPKAGTIRDVWLAQPALDMAVYVLANLCLLSRLD